MQPTTPNNGGEAVDSDGVRVSATVIEASLTTSAAGTDLDLADFGLVPALQVCGTLWEDRNGNALVNLPSPDNAIAGHSVELQNSGGSTLSTTRPTATACTRLHR